MLTYRLASKADIENIVTLVESAYRGESSRQGWTTEADFIKGQRTDYDEVATLMNASNNAFLLCESGGRLLASVHLCKLGNKACLGMFAVEPSGQGQGTGKALLLQAEHYAVRQWHCVAMLMTVISIRSELIHWYLRQGYMKTGKFKAFPYEEPRYGIPLRHDLVLETLEKKFR